MAGRLAVIGALLGLLGCPVVTDADLAARVDADGDGACDRALDPETCHDCDDGDPERHPAATEVWYDGVDQDCGGGSDFDRDGDGADAIEGEGGDCDDADPEVFPGAVEDCNGLDDDCSGDVPGDELDVDGDGVPRCALDCDDDDPSAFPGGQEVCDAADVDEDCDGAADDADADAAGHGVWYADGDGDGWGDTRAPTERCDGAQGYVASAGDCDDADPYVHPESTWLTDADGDGWGDDATAVVVCEAPEGAVLAGGDCDDADEAVNPGAVEVCGEADDDCDGHLDLDDADFADPNAEWWRDADGDGAGNAAIHYTTCSLLTGYVHAAGDCDDTDPTVYEGAPEVCGGVDDDCDGDVDDADPDVSGRPTWYEDGDADGYGTSAATTEACDPGAGWAATDDDCDDGEPGVSPGAAESCAAGDEDCDGLDGDADPDVADGTSWFPDADGDGAGDPEGATVACDTPAGFLGVAGDCDDADATVSPAEPERCVTDADDDCDGDPNPPDAEGCSFFYEDADGDGHGAGAGTCLCVAQALWSAEVADDCDDAEAGVHPGAAEDCATSADDDCDGDTNDDGAIGCADLYPDADGDGYGDEGDGACLCEPAGDRTIGAGGDCDDGDPAIHAGAPVVCLDGADQDCDGAVDVCAAYDGGPWTGEAASDVLGGALALADLDGDGVASLILGASSADDGGAVYLLDGSASAGEAEALSSAWVTTLDAYEGLGHAVARLGDVDGDGADELAMSAYAADLGATNSGSVYVLSGVPAAGAEVEDVAVATLYGEGGNDYLGDALSAAGDVDGDGLADVLAGARYEASVYWDFDTPGRVYVFGGGTTGTVRADAAVAIVTPEADDDDLGHAVAGGEDLDGDGIDDVAATAYRAPSDGAYQGITYVLHGPLSGTVSAADAGARLEGEGRYDYAGTVVAVCPDLDGDGSADVVVGAPGVDDGGSYAGAAYVVPGTVSGAVTLSVGTRHVGEAANDAAGTALACGDMDGDGAPELFVGATDTVYRVTSPSVASSLTDAADAWAWSGAGDAFALGDADGDGVDDLLLGSSGDDTAASNAGAAWLVLGGVR